MFNVGGVTLTDNGAGGSNNDSIVVGGKVSLNSSDSFLVTTTNTDILTATSTSSSLNSVAAIDVGTRTGASDSLAVIDEALETFSDERASLGSVQNRFESTISNLQTISENLTTARSRIRDADFALETANLTRNQILQQAGTAMLAQSESITTKRTITTGVIE